MEDVIVSSKKAERVAHLKTKIRLYETLRERQKITVAEIWSEYTKKSEEEAALQKKIDDFRKDNTDECRQNLEDFKRVSREVLALGDAKSEASSESRRLARKIATNKVKLVVAEGRLFVP